MKNRKIFLDTNIWLRIILQDTKQAPYCIKLMTLIEDGQYSVVASTIVLLEIHFVLQRLFKYTPEEIASIFTGILKIRGLQLIEKTRFELAMKNYALHPKLADCLIASQIPENTLFVSYDHDFDKLALKRYTPEMLLTN